MTAPSPSAPQRSAQQHTTNAADARHSDVISKLLEIPFEGVHTRSLQSAATSSTFWEGEVQKLAVPSDLGTPVHNKNLELVSLLLELATPAERAAYAACTTDAAKVAVISRLIKRLQRNRHSAGVAAKASEGPQFYCDQNEMRAVGAFVLALDGGPELLLQFIDGITPFFTSRSDGSALGIALLLLQSPQRARAMGLSAFWVFAQFKQYQPARAAAEIIMAALHSEQSFGSKWQIEMVERALFYFVGYAQPDLDSGMEGGSPLIPAKMKFNLLQSIACFYGCDQSIGAVIGRPQTPDEAAAFAHRCAENVRQLHRVLNKVLSRSSQEIGESTMEYRLNIDGGIAIFPLADFSSFVRNVADFALGKHGACFGQTREEVWNNVCGRCVSWLNGDGTHALMYGTREFAVEERRRDSGEEFVLVGGTISIRRCAGEQQLAQLDQLGEHARREESGETVWEKPDAEDVRKMHWKAVRPTVRNQLIDAVWGFLVATHKMDAAIGEKEDGMELDSIPPLDRVRVLLESIIDDTGDGFAERFAALSASLDPTGAFDLAGVVASFINVSKVLQRPRIIGTLVAGKDWFGRQQWKLMDTFILTLREHGNSWEEVVQFARGSLKEKSLEELWRTNIPLCDLVGVGSAAMRDDVAKAAGYDSRFACRTAQLDALAEAEGHGSRFERAVAQADTRAQAEGYTDRKERSQVQRTFPPNCWIYRVVHDPGVAIRRNSDFDKGHENGNLTGEDVLFGTVVGVVERRTRSDGMTYLKTNKQTKLGCGSTCFEGWVFERSPDGTECLKLVREAK